MFNFVITLVINTSINKNELKKDILTLIRVKNQDNFVI